MCNDLKAKKLYINIDGYRMEDKFNGLDDSIKIEMLRKRSEEHTSELQSLS